MRLSAPIYRLKQQARILARRKALPLHAALDRLAVDEGFRSWSHLATTASARSPAAVILSRLEPGDLILLGARPGHGKTLLGLELASCATQLGRKGFFFTLDYHAGEVAGLLSMLGINPAPEPDGTVVDTSDDVSADYIVSSLKRLEERVIVVVDYLQILDQKRTNPGLEDQIASLRRYVKAEEAICVVIAQIDRSFDLSGRPMPEMSDVRLPNPLDLSAFDKVCFLHNGQIQIDQAA